MKRVLTLALVLAMLAGALTVTAGAADSSGYFPAGTTNTHFTADNAPNTGDKTTGNAGNATAGVEEADFTDPIEKQVTVKLNTAGDVSTTHVYAVTYDATELTFTYTYGGSRIWNPETLAYEYSGTTTGWGTETTKDIKVTNYSDMPVKITAAASESTVTGVTVDVKKTGEDTTELTLGSAYNSGNPAASAPVGGSFTVTVGGAPSGDYSGHTLSTITLTLSKAS